MLKRLGLLALIVGTLVLTPFTGTQTASAAECSGADNPICTVSLVGLSEDQQNNKACPAGFNEIGRDQGAEIRCQKIYQLSDQAQKALTENVGTIQVIINVLSRILWPVLALIGGLMDNSLLFSNGMEARLREIWIVIRNLVNIFFVIVLVGIALYNVLGLGEDGDNYSVKAALPKIIIALIAINFSFLAIKVFLDAVSIATTAVFALPQQVEQSLANIDLSQEEQKLFCQKISSYSNSELGGRSPASIDKEENEKIYRKVAGSSKFKSFFQPTLSSSATAEQIKTIVNGWEASKKNEFDRAVEKEQKALVCKGDFTFTDKGQEYFKQYNVQNAAFAMALSMGKITLYDTTLLHQLSTSEAIKQIGIGLISGVIMYVIYAASFIALFIVLLGRLVFMWISVVLSPVILLLFASPELKGASSKLGELTDKFVKNAVAPLIIGAVMSIGWIMNRTLQNLNNATDNNSILNGIDPTGGLPVAGLNTLQDLIVAAVPIAIVWIGVFAAAEGTLAEGATNWMKEKIASAGKFIATTPLKHAPIFPVTINSDGETVEASVGDIGEALNQKLYNLSRPDPDVVRSLLDGKKVTGAQDRPTPFQYRDATTDEEIKKLMAKELSTGEINPESLKELKNNRNMPQIIRNLEQDGSVNRSQSVKLAAELKNLGSANETKDFEKIAKNIRLIRHPELELSAEEKAKSAGKGPVQNTNVEIKDTTNIGGRAFQNNFPAEIDDNKFQEFKESNGISGNPDFQAYKEAQKRNLQTGINSLASAINAGRLNESDLRPIADQLKVVGLDQGGNKVEAKVTQKELEDLLGKDLYGKLTPQNLTSLDITQ